MREIGSGGGAEREGGTSGLHWEPDAGLKLTNWDHDLSWSWTSTYWATQGPQDIFVFKKLMLLWLILTLLILVFFEETPWISDIRRWQSPLACLSKNSFKNKPKSHHHHHHHNNKQKSELNTFQIYQKKIFTYKI